MRKLLLTFFIIFLTFNVQAQDKPDYVLGTGDMVRINVYGNQDLTTETRVTADGTLTFPLLGEVLVGGLTAADAEKKIATALEAGGFIKQPQVNVTVLQFQSQMVSVLGDVNKPGRYPLDRRSTLTDLLATAGGVNANGSELVTITGVREGKTENREYDLRELFEHAQTSQNPMIQSDDIIYVHSREVSILGQVNRPGKYSVLSGVRNVGDFLAMAGGIAQDGSNTIVVTLLRNGKSIKQEIDVDQLLRSGNATANIELRGGDIIYVPRQPMFYIYGEVQRPGAFRLERNMSVAQAIAVGGGLTVRGTERGTRIKYRDPSGQIQLIEPQPDYKLMADDVVYVKESLF